VKNTEADHAWVQLQGKNLVFIKYKPEVTSNLERIKN